MNKIVIHVYIVERKRERYGGISTFVREYRSNGRFLRRSHIYRLCVHMNATKVNAPT